MGTSFTSEGAAALPRQAEDPVFASVEKLTYAGVFELMQRLEAMAEDGDRGAAEEYERILTARKRWGSQPCDETWTQIFTVAEMAREKLRRPPEEPSFFR